MIMQILIISKIPFLLHNIYKPGRSSAIDKIIFLFLPMSADSTTSSVVPGPWFNIKMLSYQ